MPERFTQAERSHIMAAVKSRNTTPEIIVRRIVHRLGYRFRLHRKDLPGIPDIVLPRLRKIINVHGCFWHLHTCPRGQRAPVNNAAYWQLKRERNARRDKQILKLLRKAGWHVLIIWECQLRSAEAVERRVVRFLES